ncbi:thermonuclease family protein [Benzoatithermus flavus]|uniref:Thermonuclease family protein n=1 Tax=Benzoatithermus flavus TaxID=3108223 RepID=A0ABU8XYI0_9PROT
MRALAVGLLLSALAAASAAAEDPVKGQGKARGPDTIAVAGTRIRLAAIEPPAEGMVCVGSGGAVPCTEAAAAALDALLARGEVACSKEHRLGHGYFLGRCTLGDGTDLALALLGQGLAQPAGTEAPDAYRTAGAEARDARRGLWAAGS